MSSYEQTSLWRTALAPRVDDPHTRERDHLRVSYLNVRERAKSLAEAIARDFPDYTVHDITHSDALWEYADLISGPDYPLNPCEVYVLGCAFLFHDLGMGLAAYSEGVEGLKKLEIWKDNIADLLRRKGIEEINEEAIENAADDIVKQVLGVVLRRLHATKAGELGTQEWKSPNGNERFHLIEDPELRTSYGPLIGRISASHWWSVDQLQGEFGDKMGADVKFPREWTVDPLKLACILRCVDYCHIDERRAPAFLRALRQPQGVSDDHWIFQGKLCQPYIQGDRIVFTATNGFNPDETEAWWLCYDTLKAIDTELSKVDALLADTDRERLKARGVSQVDDPSRLSRIIKTNGWRPVDTQIRVSAVADLIGKLGGKELYGDRVEVPLRELIQNAADAVRARRLIDSRLEDWGEIRITTGKDDEGVWIQAEDTGIGMSVAVLTGPFLDFGTSFWGSTLMHEELPGLAAKGFEPIGRYGIGFYSLFMWGEHVEVTTQRFDRGREETLVLSFRKGLKERPLLRSGRSDECIPDGGTRVRVWFTDEKTLDRLIAHRCEDPDRTLVEVCAQIAPCLDVSVKATGKNHKMIIAVKANDWLTISDSTLLERLPQEQTLTQHKYSPTIAGPLSILPLTILTNNQGYPVGRAALWNIDLISNNNSTGALIVGGLLNSQLDGLVGVLVGRPKTITRDSAIPIVTMSTLREWIMKEGYARLHEGHSPEDLTLIANVLIAFGVDPLGFPVAKGNYGWMTAEDISMLAVTIDEVLVVCADTSNRFLEISEEFHLNQNVLIAFILESQYAFVRMKLHPDSPFKETDEFTKKVPLFMRTIESVIIRSLANGWACSIEEVLQVSSFELRNKLPRRQVGTIAGKPYMKPVDMIIRRPNSKSGD